MVIIDVLDENMNTLYKKEVERVYSAVRTGSLCNTDTFVFEGLIVSKYIHKYI